MLQGRGRIQCCLCEGGCFGQLVWCCLQHSCAAYACQTNAWCVDGGLTICLLLVSCLRKHQGGKMRRRISVPLPWLGQLLVMVYSALQRLTPRDSKKDWQRLARAWCCCRSPVAPAALLPQGGERGLQRPVHAALAGACGRGDRQQATPVRKCASRSGAGPKEFNVPHAQQSMLLSSGAHHAWQHQMVPGSAGSPAAPTSMTPKRTLQVSCSCTTLVMKEGSGCSPAASQLAAMAATSTRSTWSAAAARMLSAPVSSNLPANTSSLSLL